MGEGQNKIARSLLDLEPTAVLDLFLVYPDYTNNKDTTYAIHGGSIFKKGVVWQGRTYMPIGMEMEGLEVNADGRLNRPKIKISNKDYFVTHLLKKFNNFEGARITQKRTLVKHLDDVNFDGGNPFGQADFRAEISAQEYIVAQKTQENKLFVEFELTSPLDLDNFELNHRRIMGKYCYWQYRGIGCRYQGIPIHKENGDDFKDVNGNPIFYQGEFEYANPVHEYSNDLSYSAGDLVFVKGQTPTSAFDQQVEGTASEYIYNYYIAKTDVKGLQPNSHPKYWDKDGCNKKLSSCQLRFNSNKTVKRFIGTESVNSNIVSLNSGSPYGAYFFRPNNVDSIVNTLNYQDSWTIAFNLKTINNNAFDAGLLYTHDEYAASGVSMRLQENNFQLSYRIEGNARGKRALTASRQFPLVNHPIILRKINSKAMSIDEPSMDSYSRLNHGNKFRNTSNDFYIGINGRNNNESKISPEMEIDSICVWRKTLTEAEINSLYYKSVDGGLRAKKYEDIPADNQLKLDLEAWWEGSFIRETDGKTGIIDKENGNDLIYTLVEDKDNKLMLQTGIDTYKYNIEQEVPTQEPNSYVPFGGFPGTDGFGFYRDL